MKKRIIALLLILVLVISAVISGCGKKEKQLEEMLVGIWYLGGEMTTTRDGGKGPELILYSDGSCEMASEYGTGKWSVVNDNQLKLTNYYGETETKYILSVGGGQLRLGDEKGKNQVVFFDRVIEQEQENGSESLVNETLDKQEEVENTITLVDAKPFSDGVAWVQYIDAQGEWQWGLLRTDGTVVQPQDIDFKEKEKSDFSAGYAYVTTDAYERGASDTPDSFKILNRDGEVTAQSPNDGNSYQIVCGGDGIFLVKQLVQSMTENTTSYGVISHNGTWIQELTPYELCGSHPLSAADGDPNWLKVNFGYKGEGVFCATYSTKAASGSVEQFVLFNAFSGQNFKWKIEYQFGAENDVVFGRFNNGSTIARLNHQAYRMTTDFELTPLDVDADKIISYSEGIFFMANEDWGKEIYTNGAFYRADGSLVADLSRYELIMSGAYNLYRYSDGYAAIVVRGQDGKKYLGIIDSNGEFNFEPRRIESVRSGLSEGTIACEIKEGNSYVSVFINVDGSEFRLSDYGQESIGVGYFSDGYLFDGKNRKFIDRNGNILSLKWA